MSTTEKITAAKTMMELNDHEQIVVTGAEVREFLGKEPLSDEDIEAVREQIDGPQPDPLEADPTMIGDQQQQQEDMLVNKLEVALRKGGGTLSLAVKP